MCASVCTGMIIKINCSNKTAAPWIIFIVMVYANLDPLILLTNISYRVTLIFDRQLLNTALAYLSWFSWLAGVMRKQHGMSWCMLSWLWSLSLSPLGIILAWTEFQICKWLLFVACETFSVDFEQINFKSGPRSFSIPMDIFGAICFTHLKLWVLYCILVFNL